MQGDIKLKIRNIEKMILHKAVLPAMYNLHKHKPVNEDLVLFADAKHGKVPFSMQAMYEAMQQEGYQAENWCVDFDALALTDKLHYLYRFMKRYAEAKYVFICDYFLPISSCHKRKETKVIHLWHACGLLKKFGYDAADDLADMKNVCATKNIDLWTVSSEACIPIFENALRMYDGQIQALGVSRTDIYYSEEYRERCIFQFYEKYPELKQKKIIVWAPTFRGNAKNPTLVGLEDIKQLQNDLGTEWHIIYKLHPHLKEVSEVDNCVFPLEELYPVVDLLITDYSSALFDYLLFEKPFLIYAPDLEEYEKKRGFYIDLKKEFQMPIITHIDDLSSAVCMIGTKKIMLTKSFKERHLNGCDGKSIQRIRDYILYKL